MYLSNFTRSLILLIYIALAPLEVWSAVAFPTKQIEVTIQDGAKVAGASVLLGDVATIYAKNFVAFEALSKLEIMQFPKDQKEIQIPASYLQARIREALGKDSSDFRLNAPGVIHFARVQLNEASPENLADRILQKALAEKKIPSGVELQVEPGQGLESIRVLNWENFRLEAAYEKPSWKGEMTFRLVPVNMGKEDKIQWFNARLRWFKDVWVAKRDLRFLEEISPSDFERRRMEISTSLDSPLEAKNVEELALALQSARAKRSIRQNSWLTSAAIEKKPDGISGQDLQIVFVGESGLKVSAYGALMENAIIGNNAKARLKKTKKIVSGKLISNNLLEVSL